MWGQLRHLLETSYNVIDDEPDQVMVRLGVGDGRTQLALVSRVPLSDGAEWISVESVIGMEDELPIVQLMAEIGGGAFGGLIMVGDRVALRQSFSAAHTPLDEANDIIQRIMFMADHYERLTIGADRH